MIKRMNLFDTNRLVDMVMEFEARQKRQHRGKAAEAADAYSQASMQAEAAAKANAAMLAAAGGLPPPGALGDGGLSVQDHQLLQYMHEMDQIEQVRWGGAQCTGTSTSMLPREHVTVLRWC